MKRCLSCIVAIAVAVGVQACAGNGAPVAPLGAAAASKAAAKTGVVACSSIRSLADLGGQVKTYQNPSTGDSIEYLVIGDGARSKDMLVMFPGTGQIMAGWPVQLVTNKKYSPKIAGTIGYKPAEDGRASLCHDYHLLLFDYPGVGATAYVPNLTRDRIANDVDALLEEVGRTTGLDTNLVDPTGWSLGTTMALKFAFLSPVSRPARVVHNLVLFATGPGGSLQGDVTHDSAACVKTLFDDSLSYTGSVESQIVDSLGKLIYPFKGQTRTENGTRSTCTATVSPSAVSLSVTLSCTRANNCVPYALQSEVNDKTYPWSVTGGIGEKVYVEERQQANDWYVDYCARAGRHFTSLRCSSYATVDMSDTNGGVCKTDTKDLDHPVARDCVKIAMTGKITVIAGYEDLFDQWTYGKALVEGYRRSQGPGAATLRLYPGSAGHGLLIQHPGYVQAMAAEAVAGR